MLKYYVMLYYFIYGKYIIFLLDFYSKKSHNEINFILKTL